MKITHSILDTIIKNTEKILEQKKQEMPLTLLKEHLGKRATPVRDFYGALAKPGRLRVMAEIKKASPSGGYIRPDFNLQTIALDYEHSGFVDAISIITEPAYFQGNPAWISELRSITTIPLFRKDFIFDEYQVYESYLLEADALLLIAAALDEMQLNKLLSHTRTLGMEALVETRSIAEINMALRAGANMIGINARDLKTFTLDQDLFAALAPHIPEGKIKIAESGLESKEDMLRVKHFGAHAVLVGTSIMKSENIPRMIENLFKDV